MLSTAEGYNIAGVAVLGAMILNLGQPTFNAYCENQRRAIGWLQSKTNPIQAEARDLRAKRRNDPSVRSMFEDVEREFMAPLVAEHVKNGGQAPSAEQVEATCAMLLAKILWDAKLGNPALAAALRMLGASLRAEAPAPTGFAGLEALEALKQKKSLTLIEAMDLTSAEMFIEAVAKVRAIIREGLFKEVLGENPDAFNKEAWHLVEELMIFCLLLADRVSFHMLEPERRAKFMDFLVVNVVSSLTASILQDRSPETISAYERDFFNLHSRRSKALARFDLPTEEKHPRGEDLFSEAARIITKERYAGSVQLDKCFAAKHLELILVDWKSVLALNSRLAGIQNWGSGYEDSAKIP